MWSPVAPDGVGWRIAPCTAPEGDSALVKIRYRLSWDGDLIAGVLRVFDDRADDIGIDQITVFDGHPIQQVIDVLVGVTRRTPCQADDS